MNVAIIPARGGSKRIPNKNIRPFHGKPIISYSIDAALESDLFSKVIVSTDSIEIAEIAEEYGAMAPFLRSESTSTDSAPIAVALSEVLQELSSDGLRFDSFCCLLATAPFVTPDLIQRVFDLYQRENASSAFTIKAFEYPIQRGLRKDDAGRLGLIWPEYLNSRSQDLEDSFHDAGQLYWARVADFEKSGSLFMERSYGYKLAPLEAMDIDTEEDWQAALKLYRMTN